MIVTIVPMTTPMASANRSLLLNTPSQSSLATPRARTMKDAIAQWMKCPSASVRKALPKRWAILSIPIRVTILCIQFILHPLVRFGIGKTEEITYGVVDILGGLFPTALGLHPLVEDDAVILDSLDYGHLVA